MIHNEHPRWFSTLLPGIVFLSLITGGGFATGREVVQYCLRHGSGPAAGVGLVVFIALWALLYLTIESARNFEVYDYRRWARVMLPRGGPVAIELVFAAMTILVCAIVLSGAGAVLQDVAVVPGTAGLIVAFTVTLVLTAVGRKAVITTKVLGGLLLAGGYVAFAIATMRHENLSVVARAGDPGWIGSATLYVGYNAVALPAALYTMRGIRSKRQAIAASMFGAFLTIIAFTSVALAISAGGPTVMSAEAPLHEVLRAIGHPALLATYYAIFVWTLVDTGVGMVYAVVVRAEEAAQERGRALKPVWRWVISAAFLGVSAALAQFGLISLIAKGYGTMAYFFIIFVIGPLVLFALGGYSKRFPRNAT